MTLNISITIIISMTMQTSVIIANSMTVTIQWPGLFKRPKYYHDHKFFLFRTCGLNAQCAVTNHNKVCSCPPDFTGKHNNQKTLNWIIKIYFMILYYLGNPAVECVRIPSTCYANTDCPETMACTEGICMPSCQGWTTIFNFDFLL